MERRQPGENGSGASGTNPHKAPPRPVIAGLQPFFSTAFGELYNADCLEFLSRLPDASVDLVIADPPYNIRKAQWDSFESQKAYIEWSMKWIREAARVLSPHGSLYICGFSEILADIKWAAAPLFTGCKWLVWYYRNKANMGNDWGRSHESVLHLRKSREFIFNTDEVRIPYNRHTLRYPKRPQAVSSQYGNGRAYEWAPNPRGAKPKDVIEVPTISNHAWEKFPHPTQKPVQLIRKFVLASSTPASTIADPFGGSGTTFAVAEAFGRRWCGCDSSAAYCETAVKRLQDTAHLQRIAAADDEAESFDRRERLR